MAVRRTASGQHYTRTLTLGSQASWSICSWVKLSVDRNDFGTFFAFQSTNSIMMEVGSDGTTLDIWDDSVGGTVGTTVALTVGTWYFVGMSVAAGTNASFMYVRAANAATATTATWTQAARTLTTLWLGQNQYGEWYNGPQAATKWWLASITQAEMDAEYRQQLPNRLADLGGFYPQVRAETTDYSGLGRTLTGGTGATTEDGPPVPWKASFPNLILPSSAAPVTNVNVEVATAIGAALDTTIAASPTVATAATATGDAQTPTANVSPGPSAATATGDANNTSSSIAANGNAATVTGDANSPNAALSSNPDVATATGAAFNVSVATSESATVGRADAIGQANDTSAAASVPVGNAAGIGTAFDVSATTQTLTNVDVPAATATGAANDAIVNTSESATPQAALATGAANDVTVTTSETASPAPALGTGAAQDVAATIGVDVGTATATGQALDVDVQTAAETNVNVTEALAIGQAFDAVTSSSTSPAVEAALATGDAYDPTVTTGNDAVVQVDVALATGQAIDLGSALLTFGVDVALGTGAALDPTVSTLAETLVPVGAAAGVGDALDPTINANADQSALVGVAVGQGAAFDPLVLGALPVGRMHVRGNEPQHHVSGYTTREPRRRLSGNEPRSDV
jgi:hypothetical protein